MYKTMRTEHRHEWNRRQLHDHIDLRQKPNFFPTNPLNSMLQVKKPEDSGREPVANQSSRQQLELKKEKPAESGEGKDKLIAKLQSLIAKMEDALMKKK